MRPRRCCPRRSGSFNPHPARRPDATQLALDYEGMPEVSILIRPEGRMQHLRADAMMAERKFQSSSGQKAGCNPRTASSANKYPRFQSSSGQKAGCNMRSQRLHSFMSRFQSSSGQKAGCNSDMPSEYHRILCRFNPHPARRPDATPNAARADRPSNAKFQSSSGQKAGCNAWSKPTPASSNPFQSSSGQKAGCNLPLYSTRYLSSRFQSSSGQKAGCNSQVCQS